MKRCRLSAVILVGLILLCILSLQNLHYQCDRMIGLTDQVITCIQRQDMTGAYAALDKLEDGWMSFHHAAGAIVKGGELESVENLLDGLRPLIDADTPAALADLERLRMRLQHIYEEQTPGFWHIL